MTAFGPRPLSSRLATGIGFLALWVAVSRLPKLPGAIPEGDIVVLAEAGGPALGRLVLAARRANTILRRWQVAGLSLLIVATLVAAALALGA